MKWRGIRADTAEAVEITVENGIIADVSRLEASAERLPALPWLSPGWIDLQVNGYAGYDFNAEQVDAEQIEGATRALHARGVALYYPTVITGSKSRMLQGLAALAAYTRSGRCGHGSITGIHLEGPYLSGADGCRGAHPKDEVRDPDWEEFRQFQEAAGGLIRLVTLAPERDGAIAFIEKLVSEGIAVAIGHTKATGEQIDRAVRAGATISTHLGNGSEQVLARHPNYIWDQLADDRLWATFIPDGHHLAPPVLKAMFRAKRDKAILVSDCVKFGGMPPGVYDSLIGGEVELHPNGRLNTVANPAILAGSAYSLERGLGNVLRYTDMSLAEAIAAVTARPARAAGLASAGRLELGCPAHLTLFVYDEDRYAVKVVETVVGGETVYRRV